MGEWEDGKGDSCEYNYNREWKLKNEQSVKDATKHCKFGSTFIKLIKHHTIIFIIAKITKRPNKQHRTVPQKTGKHNKI